MQNSPSWGGHLYAVMASSDGFTGNNPVTVPGVTAGSGWGCDSNRVANGGAFRATPVHQAPTIMDLLDSARLSWTIYGSRSGQAGYIWATCPSIAECLYTQQSHIRESEQFVTDAQAGHLPNFSLVVLGDKTNPDSQHNGTSMTAGDNWVGQVAGAVMTGPEWTSTALFITYDDCGCFYDQVPPGTNPDGTARGPRAPLLIVAPTPAPASPTARPPPSPASSPTPSTRSGCAAWPRTTPAATASPTRSTTTRNRSRRPAWCNGHCPPRRATSPRPTPATRRDRVSATGPGTIARSMYMPAPVRPRHAIAVMRRASITPCLTRPGHRCRALRPRRRRRGLTPSTRIPPASANAVTLPPKSARPDRDPHG